jgi:hypothetical protein
MKIDLGPVVDVTKKFLRRLYSFVERVPYWYLLAIPYASLYFGIALNQLVMVVNHNQMPVDWPQSLWDAECSDPTTMAQQGDLIHSCMTHATHLKFLCDWIVLGNPGIDGIMSTGDLFIFLYDLLVPLTFYIWVVLVIKGWYGIKNGSAGKS